MVVSGGSLGLVGLVASWRRVGALVRCHLDVPVCMQLNSPKAPKRGKFLPENCLLQYPLSFCSIFLLIGQHLKTFLATFFCASILNSDCCSLNWPCECKSLPWAAESCAQGGSQPARDLAHFLSRPLQTF